MASVVHREFVSLFPVSELSLVLLGNYFRLKALMRDLLLGNNLSTQHDKCVKVRETFQDKPVTVIHTPDQLLSTTSQQELQQFIQDIKDLSAPVPHVFLLVLQPEDFTEQHKSRLQSVLESLSEQAFQHSLVLMFRPQAETPGDIQELCQICGGGCLIFNLRDQQQVSELLESVETLKAKNEAHSFTTETLVQGQREKISALQKELQERSKFLIQVIMRRYKKSVIYLCNIISCF
uniref:AIG1-type G domain-containing protein n=1 Tax=Periophthalmus magnuspinnatus TaxID=409849 RepID=A0A3B3ZWN9_9GOBI